MLFDIIETSCAVFGLTIGKVDVDSEVVGKGAGDGIALCVFLFGFY